MISKMFLAFSQKANDSITVIKMKTVVLFCLTEVYYKNNPLIINNHQIPLKQ